VHLNLKIRSKEKTKTYVTEEKVKEIVEGAITTLKPSVPEGGEE
jgi:hypothetical protein